ncbi:metalloregulator ArsR/SmtB family transcription factor [Leifsonia sp. AG29]|uniref:metalloregulator ArsR/SmtB family transcription factor n=1 Tax=Leifsonia sp. AG29 TaxID=2598860 RepID=UPI00131DAC29|nr:metalloregulator ArsR/SmtB family transcription factor [Leifsonia sp. AG29]
MSTSPASAFAALADPTRAAIVDLLARRGELAAGEIGAEFTSSASAISQHLKVLREAGLVTVEKRAQQRVYRLNVTALAAAEAWLSDRARQWNARVDALAAYIEKTRDEGGLR